jgi:DUF917 family protein
VNPDSIVVLSLKGVMAFVAVQIELSGEQRRVLEAIVSQRMVTRARVVLLASEGLANRQIAPLVGLSEQKVGQWCNRFAERRLDGLGDLPPGSAAAL